MYVPKKMFLTKGVGVHKEKLASFEMALRNAKIAHFNLVEVSSIYPPHCEMVEPDAGLEGTSPGQIMHVVLSRNSTNEPGRMIAASVGVAMPTNPELYGYLSEHHSYGEDEETAAHYAEDLAGTMLATIMGIEFDPDDSFRNKIETWRDSGRIGKLFSTTQTALGDKGGQWTTVITASVLLP
ncbi:MAG: pyruvoyl-dependent arginine decarboxylase [Calditrichia bacterium]